MCGNQSEFKGYQSADESLMTYYKGGHSIYRRLMCENHNSSKSLIFGNQLLCKEGHISCESLTYRNQRQSIGADGIVQTSYLQVP